MSAPAVIAVPIAPGITLQVEGGARVADAGAAQPWALVLAAARELPALERLGVVATLAAELRMPQEAAALLPEIARVREAARRLLDRADALGTGGGRR